MQEEQEHQKKKPSGAHQCSSMSEYKPLPTNCRKRWSLECGKDTAASGPWRRWTRGDEVTRRHAGDEALRVAHKKSQQMGQEGGVRKRGGHLVRRSDEVEVALFGERREAVPREVEGRGHCAARPRVVAARAHALLQEAHLHLAKAASALAKSIYI